MSDSYMSSLPDKTITDTCPCGATLKIVSKYPESAHITWLQAHEICRNKLALADTNQLEKGTE